MKEQTWSFGYKLDLANSDGFRRFSSSGLASNPCICFIRNFYHSRLVHPFPELQRDRAHRQHYAVYRLRQCRTGQGPYMCPMSYDWLNHRRTALLAFRRKFSMRFHLTIRCHEFPKNLISAWSLYSANVWRYWFGFPEFTLWFYTYFIKTLMVTENSTLFFRI